MPPEAQGIATAIACFALGIVLGYIVKAQRHANEVREWMDIARKAQRLNTLAATLKQERGNGSQYAHQSNGDDQQANRW